jgi:hypothetical protein
MASCAQQVVAAMASRLSGNTAAGSRVYTDRLWPIDKADLPAILVLAGDERIKPVTVHWPRVNEHRLELMVAYKVRALSGMDVALDTGLLAILAAVMDTAEHAQLGILPQPLAELERKRRLPDVAELKALGESEYATGQVLVVFEACFQTTDVAPETFA